MGEFIFISAVAFFTSYGWGMRGCMIGGEHGAVLPGALLGLSLSLFSGIPFLSENAVFLVAAGALTMFYGGTEPYAQTCSPILHPEKEKFMSVKKAYAAIFLKGALWFGLCGAGIGLLFACAGGAVSPIAAVLLLITSPVVQFIGVKLFNSPYDVENKRFPKIYFCKTSREEWGGNLLFLLEILITACCLKNTTVVVFSLFGVLFGGIGFCFGYFAEHKAETRKKNGKYVFGVLQEKRLIDTWKLMEFLFGGIGGAGIAAAFLLCKREIVQYVSTAQQLGFFSSGKEVIDNYTLIYAFASVIPVVITMYLDYKGKKFKLNLSELIQRPFVSTFLFIFVLLGSKKAAYIGAVAVPVFVMWMHNFFDAFKFSKLKIPVRTFLSLLLIAVTSIVLIKSNFPMILAVIIYTFVYSTVTLLFFTTDCDSADFAGLKHKERIKKVKNPLIVQTTFFIQSIIITLVTAYNL